MEIEIDGEFFEKYEEDFEFDKSEFETDQKIEVRIPFTGYYSLKVNCKNPQVAMAEVLKINRDIGILDIVGSDTVVEDINENETYAVISENNK